MTDIFKSPSIPALSVRQPWAQLLLRGVKGIEVRTWGVRMSGFWMWIHASQTLDRWAADAFAERYKLFLPLGCYVGTVFVKEIIEFTPETWRELVHEHHCHGMSFKPGLKGWRNSRAYQFTNPVPGRGQRGLFAPQRSSLERLRQEARHAVNNIASIDGQSSGLTWKEHQSPTGNVWWAGKPKK